MPGRSEIVRRHAAEIREGDGCRRRIAAERQRQRHIRAAAFLRLQVPLALFAPAEPDGTKRRYRPAILIQCHRLPVRVVRFAQRIGEIGGA